MYYLFYQWYLKVQFMISLVNTCKNIETLYYAVLGKLILLNNTLFKFLQAWQEELDKYGFVGTILMDLSKASQPAFTCSKLTVETVEQVVK